MSSPEKSVDLEKFTSSLKKLELSLLRVDPDELARGLLSYHCIPKECKEKFSTLDPGSTEAGTKVRYLLMHAHKKIKDDISLIKGFCQCLSEKFKLERVLSSCFDSSSNIQGGWEIENYVLTLEDESDLTELLYEAAPKWKHIGIALKLSHPVRHNCFSEDCIIALSNTLHEWLQNSKEPCRFQTLINALQSPIVGHSRIAQDLIKNFIEKKTTTAACIRDEERSEHEPHFYYSSSDTEVAEGKSVLLEVRSTSTETQCLQWSKDGVILNDSEEYYCGTKDNILLIHSADLVQQGMYQCKIMDDNGSTLAVSGSINLKVLLSPERLLLRSRYSCESVTPTDSIFWPLVTVKKFINLALINNFEKCEASYKYTMRGDIDDIKNVGKKLVHYSKIFENYIERCLILVEGRPGSGKTTLVHKLCQDWGLKGNVLKNARLVYFIYLRLLSDKDIHLSDILKKLFYSEPMHIKDLDVILQKMLKTNGQNICFVLDGLDEYSLLGRKDTAIHKLIHKELLPDSMVIVSSRPAASANVRMLRRNIRIEVLGFSLPEIVDYVKSYPFDDYSMSDSLLKFLETHSNVMHMCYLPIHMAMICYLYDRLGSRIPNTESKIYEIFTLQTILRHLNREGYHLEVTSLKDLQGEERESFRCICKHALKLTLRIEQGFNSSDISTEKQTLGLITLDKVAQIFRMKNFYTYHHQTFQEFLSAWYIAHIGDEFQEDSNIPYFINALGENFHMKMVWKFYCGIVCFEGKISHFESIIKTQFSDSLYAIQCAFESQQSALCECIQESAENNILVFKQHIFLPYERSAIEYFISKSTRPIQLDFENCSFETDSKIANLPKVSDMGLVDQKMDPLKTLLYYTFKMIYHRAEANRQQTKLTEIQIQIDGATHLASIQVTLYSDSEYEYPREQMEMLKFKSLKVHEVSLNIIPGYEYREYTKWEYRRRRSTSIRSNLCIVFGFPAVFQGSLPEVSIRNYNIKGFKDINNVHFCECTYLSLVDCGINDKLADQLASGLESCIKLKSLTLDFNSLSDIGAQSLARSLKNCTLFKHFSILANNVHDLGAIDLLQSLINCKDMSYLDFQGNNISTNGMKEALEIHKQFFPEAVLNIWNKNLNFGLLSYGSSYSKNELALPNVYLCNVLKYFPSLLSNQLQVLDISCNCLYTEDMSVVAHHLSCCKDLEKLMMGSNCFDYGDAKSSLYECLKIIFSSCTKIRYLDLSYNEIACYDPLHETELHQLKDLQYLDLSGNAGLFNFEVMKQADEIICCRNLITLLLNESDIKPNGLIYILTKCTKLKELGLAYNHHMAESFLPILMSLMQCFDLRILNLTQNNLGKDILKKIPLSIIAEISILLEHLEFSGNYIYEEGFAFLCSLNWCTLHTLDVSRNSIGSADMNALIFGLKFCVMHLDTLKISYNNISDNAIISLSDTLAEGEEANTTSLITLNISHNKLGDIGLLLLIKICTKLISLDISHNKITPAGINTLRASSSHFTHLQYEEQAPDMQ